jgi:hypothetical protein
MHPGVHKTGKLTVPMVSIIRRSALLRRDKGEVRQHALPLNPALDRVISEPRHSKSTWLIGCMQHPQHAIHMQQPQQLVLCIL